MKQIYILIITVFIYSSSLAQNAEDTTDGKFHDDLLNHFVGIWNVSGVVHGMQFQNLKLEATWTMNHQYLQIHEKGTDTVPFINMPWEAMFIIGYNHNTRRYVFYEFSVRGIDGPWEGFSYASRTGNELKASSVISPEEKIIQRFTWQPSSGSWHLETMLEKAGKEGEPYPDLNAVSATSSN